MIWQHMLEAQLDSNMREQIDLGPQKRPASLAQLVAQHEHLTREIYSMFKITIEETKTVKAVSGKEWAKIDTVEIAREDCFLTGENDPKTRIKDVMGYTPEIEKQVSVKRDVLVQVVDELDLARVIKAINGLD